MLNLKIGDKEFQIKYGYKATAQNGTLIKLAKFENIDDEAERLDKMLKFLPEMLLVGLQKFHTKEFGFANDDEKKKQLEKIYDLLDTYFDDEDGDILDLYGQLQNELFENGFLKKLLSQEQEKTKKSSSKN